MASNIENIALRHNVIKLLGIYDRLLKNELTLVYY